MGKALLNTYTRSYAITNAQEIQTPPRIELQPRTHKLTDLLAYRARIQGPGLTREPAFKNSIKVTWQIETKSIRSPGLRTP